MPPSRQKGAGLGGYPSQPGAGRAGGARLRHDSPLHAQRELAARRSFLADIGKALAKAPIHAYRWTLKPLIGLECRHLPTCSAYALDAIDLNGAWRGSWLGLSRVCRCHPWGTSGFDPAPDIRGERHVYAPWRYGRWK